MKRAVFLLVCMLLLAAPAYATTIIAYDIPGIEYGNDTWGGSLGMRFNVNAGKSITVTALGVFDSGPAGISSGTTLYAVIFDRVTKAKVTDTLSFTHTDAGTLLGGSRFKDLTTPVTLTAGDYMIVSWGYNSSDKMGNQGILPAPTPSIMHDGGGLISFLSGGGYWSAVADAGKYPTSVSGDQTNRYLAGTFEFVPLPSTVLLLGSGLVGLGLLRRRWSLKK